MTFTKWLICSAFVLPAMGQTFSSGSTGADGALTLNTPGTYVFDPKTFSPALDQDGDNIFHFTTITIGAGVIVKLTGSIFNTPVVWLAQGEVKVDGTIDLSGQNSFIAQNTTQRTNTIPGAGGFAGGYPRVGANPGSAGLGPAGGAYACHGVHGHPGGFTGSQFLVPLVGGSGGGADIQGGVGGAGGGAILIASSNAITGTGSINANGGSQIHTGNGYYTGSGAGGGIRLVAPSVTISGSLSVSHGGGSGCAAGAHGVVRVEAFQIGSLNVSGGFYTATPFGLFLPSTGVPSIRVTTVGGNAVATSPTGTFTTPDVSVNSNSPLPVVIQAVNVPLGTIPALTIFSENGPDQIITAPALGGTLAASTSTVNVTLPSGFSKGFVKATFTQ